MEIIYVLTEEEKKIVDTHRHNRRAHLTRLAQRCVCQHSWRYDGHSHNDDCYICTICGETEFGNEL